jgi:hypothetical protein
VTANKRSTSLQRHWINYDRKKFYRAGPNSGINFLNWHFQLFSFEQISVTLNIDTCTLQYHFWSSSDFEATINTLVFGGSEEVGPADLLDGALNDEDSLKNKNFKNHYWTRPFSWRHDTQHNDTKCWLSSCWMSFMLGGWVFQISHYAECRYGAV